MYTYTNGRVRLCYENYNERHDITLNIQNVYIGDDKVFLDPFIRNSGLLKMLKKARIIKEICGTINYHYMEIPFATLNMGVLKTYDLNGVNKYMEKKSNYEI